MFRSRGSHKNLFILQSDDHIGRLGDRRKNEEFEYAVSGHPFENSQTNTRRIGSFISTSRIRTASIIFTIIFLVFLGRSSFLQVARGEEYRALAEGNRYRTARVMPQRGLIYDRNGLLLAKNVPAFVLTMTISELPSDEQQRRNLFLRVSDLSGVQPTDLDLLVTQYAETPNEPVPVKRHLSFERAIHLAIETKKLQGFDIASSSLREYPKTDLSLAHILGYTGKISSTDLETLHDQGYRAVDTIGKIGVEKSAENILRGTPGEVVVEVDARGRELSVVSETEPIKGSDIKLTIDAEFQSFIETRLNNLFDVAGLSRASVVALNPKTGEIYALVSLPGYDNNLFARGIEQDALNGLLEDQDRPLFARAIAGEFPSGSTFKPFVAYAALAEGVVSEHTSFLSTGGLSIGQWFFPDWKVGGHGVTDVKKAIAESVNTYFYIISGGFDRFNGLGVKRMTDYAARFGFGSMTGIDLPGEADGFLPSKEWKEEVKGERWYVGDTYHLAIGQGDFLTTPLQMARATGIIANNGVAFKPHISDADQTRAEPILDLDAYALAVVKRAMRDTVLVGSARSLAGFSFDPAGKTGTAQAPGIKRFHSWFTGFAPYNDPTIALAILIEEGGESTEAAVPLAGEIFYWWFVSNPHKQSFD